MNHLPTSRSDALRRRADAAAARFSSALARAELELREYDPDQPRLPAGQPGGGQWTSEGEPPGGLSRIEALVAAARGRRNTEAFCEALYEKDLFQCRLVGISACYAQAMKRYAACLSGQPVPPLNY